MIDRDIDSIRYVGTLALVLGAVLMILAILSALFGLYIISTSNGGQLIRGALSVFVAVIMAVSLIGCGGAMHRVRPTISADRENLRLVWTGLVVMMTFCGLANLWLVQPLAAMAGLMLLALFAIRGAIIRLTR